MTTAEPTRRPEAEAADLEPLCSINKAAELLDISTNHAYRLAHAGELPVPVVYVGAVMKVRRSDLRRLLDPRMSC